MNTFAILFALFLCLCSLLSCSSAPPASPGPQIDPYSSKSEATALRAEYAAQKSEDWAKKAQEAYERAEAAAQKAEMMLKKAEEEGSATYEDVRWQYEKNAIRINIVSDPQLNLYQGSYHTLLLCIYQLRDPNSFNRMIETNEGLSNLLECAPYDSSALNVKRLVIQPGNQETEFLDRSEEAKYVGVIGGYYVLKKERVTRLFKIPVVEEQKGSKGKGKVLKPGMLNINLFLGPQEIQEVTTK